jgi:hypothetical protein
METIEAKKYINYIPGDKLYGIKIGKIFSVSNSYLVYEEKKNKTVRITYDFNGDDPISNISSKIVEVNALTQKLYNSKKYNGSIAEAYTECLQGNIDNSLSILGHIIELSKRDFANQIKITYLICTLSLIIINTGISLTLYYTKNIFNYGPLYQYFLIATFGSFGGFLSTIYKINKLNFQEESSKILLFFLSISRVFLSMLSSIVIYILIKSNILLGIFNNIENVYVYYIFSIAAGFSETFVPDILKKIQNSSFKEGNN